MFSNKTNFLNFKKKYFFIYFKNHQLSKYFQHNRERLQNQTCERYQSLSKKEKDKKQQYG